MIHWLFVLWHKVRLHIVEEHSHRELASPHRFTAYFCRSCGEVLVL